MLIISRVYLLNMENVQGHVRQVLKVIEITDFEYWAISENII